MKSQASLEYLVVYGFAVLSIIIVGIALWSMGIFNPSTGITPQVTGLTMFSVIDVGKTSATSLQKLPYWTEDKVDGVNATIWIKIPEIPANGETTIYMYYGNPDVSSESNASAVFLRIIDNVVGAWSFDEGSGSVAHDASGNGNDATIYGATWVDGKFGKALNFDGVNDYVIKNPFSDFPSTEITAEFWMKSSDTVNRGTPISYAASSSDNEFLIYNYQGFRIYRGSNYKITGVSANDGSWHHIVVTWRGSDGQIKVYKDGVQVYSGTLASGTTITDGGSFVIAQEQDSVGNDFESTQAFKGIMDEVRIYNRSLTQEEISDLYDNRGYVTPKYPGKVLIRKYAPNEPTVTFGSIESTDYDGWQYKQKITISNPNVQILTDYQVKISVDYQSGMKSDFSDLRFFTGEEPQEKIVIRLAPRGDDVALVNVSATNGVNCTAPTGVYSPSDTFDITCSKENNLPSTFDIVITYRDLLSGVEHREKGTVRVR